MYSKRSNLVIGFHGCDEEVANSIITGETYMSKSSNDYDWLGNGIYFCNAGFKEKNHIQICVRNPNCIKGFLNPSL